MSPDADSTDPVADGLDSRLVRYDRALLVDPALQGQLRQRGYAVVDRCVDPAVVGALRSVALDFLNRLDEPWGATFLTAGRIQDPVLRAEVSARCADLALPALRPLFVDGTALYGSALQIKPPSERSELNCHQDSSLVDERRWLGVYAWIALDDTNSDNGALHVLPGSHRFGNLQRTLNIPWQLAPFGDVMAEHSVELTCPAGTIVLFDSALVHSSPPNRSDETRLAVNAFAASPEAPMLHFFADETTPAGFVEAYQIDASFFRDDDIMDRPAGSHRSLGTWPQHRLDWSPEEFEAICRLAVHEAEHGVDRVSS